VDDHGGKPLQPAPGLVQLQRPGQTQRRSFALDGGVLVSSQVVSEPHLFKGIVDVQTGGGCCSSRSRDEGAVTMTAEQIKAAGISIETSGRDDPFRAAAAWRDRFNEDRTAHVVPRVGGVVESVPVALGQQVVKGQVLAVISSSSVSDQRAELQAAQKRLQLARTTYEREKQLFEQRISPQQDVQQAEQAMREAEIAVANARQKLQAIGATPTRRR
jgi:cobalt-zinc-cadmium efflux system membrane fusion protein